jgi:hypothetical protein
LEQKIRSERFSQCYSSAIACFSSVCCSLKALVKCAASYASRSVPAEKKMPSEGCIEWFSLGLQRGLLSDDYLNRD